jgi:transcriptional regulator with XRE-family HTH domain
MERIPPHRRPHYPPIERLAILELRAARGWSLAQTARRLLVTPLTVASWSKRLDDEGPGALIQLREPVNRFPEFVRYVVPSWTHRESQAPIGVIGAAYELLDQDTLIAELHGEVERSIRWIEDHLATPDRFNRTKSKGWYRRETRGIAWLRASH